MNVILQMFSYSFMNRAFWVGTLVALCAALLGVILVLKRFSMIGDGLSHVGFGALSVAFALNLAPLPVAIPVVVLAAFFLLRLRRNAKTGGDAAIAIVSSAAVAVGIIATSLSSGLNTDVYGYLFGSILAMSALDVVLCSVLSLVVIGVFVLCFPRIFAVTFDEGFARATGVRVQTYHLLIALLTAVTVVAGMRMMGTMLISSLIIFPALSAMHVFRTFKSVVLCAAVVSCICVWLGLVSSYLWNLPAGASVVVANLVCYCLCFAIGRAIKRS